jgi:hypothetical protein
VVRIALTKGNSLSQTDCPFERKRDDFCEFDHHRALTSQLQHGLTDFQCVCPPAAVIVLPIPLFPSVSP